MADSNKKAFFETLPGILTGIAAILGAIATLYLAFRKDTTKSEAAHLETEARITATDSQGNTATHFVHDNTGGKTENTPPNNNKDAFEVISMLPEPNSSLSRNAPFVVSVRVRYKLISAETALFVSYLEAFADNDECATGSHQTIASAVPNQIPIKRGEGEISYQITFTPGNEVSKDRGFHAGHVGVGASLWGGFDNQGRVITMVENVWNMKNYCYKFQ